MKNKSVYDMDSKEFMGELSDKATPQEILDHAGDIYAFLTKLFGENCFDSLLREWSFQWYCEKTGNEYDTIYYKWLDEA
jgi:hypothetical protein